MCLATAAKSGTPGALAFEHLECFSSTRARSPASPPADATCAIKMSWSKTFSHSGVMTRVF